MNIQVSHIEFLNKILDKGLIQDEVDPKSHRLESNKKKFEIKVLCIKQSFLYMFECEVHRVWQRTTILVSSCLKTNTVLQDNVA